MSWYEDLKSLLAYTFYVPTMVTGFMVNYDKFKHAFELNDNKLNIFQFIKDICRFVFWVGFVDVALYYNYSKAIQRNKYLMNSLDTQTLFGICLTMGYILFFKHLTFYGISKPFLEADNVESPSLPKCVLSIYRLSDFWRTINNGQYRFMVKYFYKPLATHYGRTIASAGVFSYLCIWHGSYPDIIMWCLINFFVLSMERLIDFVVISYDFSAYRRLQAAFHTPLWLLNILSHMYFLMGFDTGNQYFKVLCFSWPWTLITLFGLYCGVEVSMEITNFRATYNKHKEE